MSRLGATVLVVCLTFGVTPAAAYTADRHDKKPTASAGTGSGSPEVVVAVGAGGEEVAVRRPGGRGRWTCRYYAFSGSLGQGLGVDTSQLLVVTPVEGQLVIMRCVDGDGARGDERWFTWTSAEPFGGSFASESAAMEARAALALPDPAIATTPPTGALLTGFPTELMLAGVPGPLAATATVGGVSATVTARAVHVDWDHGDATTQRCVVTQDCTHTYTHRSTRRGDGTEDPAGTFPLTATVTWEVTWTSTLGDAGTLEPLTRAATVPVRVSELQAVVN